MRRLTHKRKNLEQCKEELESWKVDKKEIKKVKEFLSEYASGRITRRRGSNTDGLIEALKNMLKISLYNISDLSKEKEIRKFYDSFLNDKIKTIKGKTYSLRYKVEALATLKRYLQWRFPDRKDLIAPLDIKIAIKSKEPEFFTIAQAERLYKTCKSAKERFIISVLFSSGARAEELLNLRPCDFEFGKDFVQLTIRTETSKTNGRTISLYWNPCFEAIPEYIAERRKEGMKDTDYVLSSGYGSMTKWFKRFVKRANLDIRLHPHLFRDSCATWLASKLNRQQLCVFFGWKFSSPMPDRYIARAGVNMQEIDTKVKNENIRELQTELERAKLEFKMKQEEMEKQIEQKIKEGIQKFEQRVIDGLKNRKK